MNNNSGTNSSTYDPLLALDNLSSELRDYFFSDETQNKLLEVINRFIEKKDDSNDIIDKISLIVGDVDLGFIKLSEITSELIKELNWPEDKAKKLACDLAGYRYLPITKFLKEDVAAQIKNWGGDPAEYPQSKIGIKNITSTELLDETIKEAGLSISPRIISRIKFLLTSRIRNVRTDTELKIILSRSEKTGGAELSSDDADKIIKILNNKLSQSKIIDDASPIKTVTEPEPKKTVTEEALPAAKKFLPPKTAQYDVAPPPPKNGLEKEIKDIKKELEQKLPPPQDFQKVVEESTENIVKRSRLRIDPAIKNRLKSIVAARLRDVRDTRETKTLLGLPAGKGGLGLDEEKAATLANLLEAEFLAIQKQFEFANRKEAELGAKKEAWTKKEEQIQKQTTEKQALDKRYFETIKKSEALLERRPIPPQAPTPKIQNGLQGSNLRPVLSPASVPLSSQKKPFIEDIKIARTTLGPVEELRALTLIEFRRLSRNPEEATLKIKDKIELLKEQSYEKYTQGIKAWQESELNKNYLNLTRSALQGGKSVPEIIKEKTDAGEETLTIAEFQSILSLNSELRF